MDSQYPAEPNQDHSILDEVEQEPINMITTPTYEHIRVAGVTFYSEDEKQKYRLTIIDDTWQSVKQQATDL